MDLRKHPLKVQEFPKDVNEAEQVKSLTEMVIIFEMVLLNDKYTELLIISYSFILHLFQKFKKDFSLFNL